MLCYLCGNTVEVGLSCPHCGANLSLYRRILMKADAYYNQGLERAQVRDLTGAIESLQLALRYNKYHSSARALLGLVYFELGEVVPAFSQWVIAQNLDPDDTLSAGYLDRVQNTPGLLDKLDTMSRKYNQALQYCRQGSQDLAVIQLRKVVNTHPNFVKARQLLALLYIDSDKLSDARKELVAAGRIDVRNTLTLRYSQEVRQLLREQSKSRKPKKELEDLTVLQEPTTYRPSIGTKFLDVLDASRSSMLTLLMGVTLGVLTCFFLVIPTIRQSAQEEAADSIVTMSNELSATRTQVSSLEEELEELTLAQEESAAALEEAQTALDEALEQIEKLATSLSKYEDVETDDTDADATDDTNTQ